MTCVSQFWLTHPVGCQYFTALGPTLFASHCAQSGQVLISCGVGPGLCEFALNGSMVSTPWLRKCRPQAIAIQVSPVPTMWVEA